MIGHSDSHQERLLYKRKKKPIWYEENRLIGKQLKKKKGKTAAYAFLIGLIIPDIRLQEKQFSVKKPEERIKLRIRLQPSTIEIQKK